MTHPLILLLAALITGNAAYAYARCKGDHWTNPMFGVVAFLMPISLPLITLYLMGRPLPSGSQLKPQLVVLLTVGNIIAVIGIVSLLAAMAG